MLDQLRRHAKSWVTKTILAAMAIGLVFYFGYSGVRRAFDGPEGKKGTVATVNGESIPLGKFEQSFENQMKFYEQITKGQPAPALSESVRQNVLQKLVQTKLFAQQAKAMGLTVSDKELVQEITSNQNFLKDGMFNKKFYLENFKPSYERSLGEDYETALREEILAEKFETLIRNSVAVSDEELQNEFRLSNTQLNLKKITLDPSQFKEDRDTQRQNAEAEILSALRPKAPAKGPSPLDAVQKKYNLKIEDTGFHSLRDKVAFVGDPTLTQVYECLFKLSAEQDTCPQAYPVGNDVLFFKLIERKEPDYSKFEAEKDSIRQALMTRRQALIVKQISDALVKQASIQTQLPSPTPNS